MVVVAARPPLSLLPYVPVAAEGARSPASLRRWNHPAQHRSRAGIILLREPGQLILLRHGQSEWNLQNRFTGWANVGLSAQGELEAQRSAELLLAEPALRLDVVYTSVLNRAISAAGPQVRRSGADAMKEAHKAIEDLKKEALEEQRDHLDEAKDSIKELEETFKDGQKEFTQEFKEGSKDASSQLTEDQRDEDEVLKDQAQTQAEAEQVEGATTNGYSQLREYKDKVIEEAEATAEEMATTIESDLKNSASTLDREQATAVQDFENKISAVQAHNYQTRQDELGASAQEIAERSSDISQNIHENSAEAAALTTSERLEADQLVSEGKGALQHMQHSKELVANSKEEVAKVAGALTTNVADVQKQFAQALAEAKQEIDGYISDTHEAVQGEDESAMQAVRELVGGAKQTLLGQLDEVKYQAKSGLKQDSDYFAAQGRQLTDLVADVRLATDKVSGMFEDIEQASPEAQTVARTTLDNIEVALSEARNALKDSQGSLGTSLSAQVEKAMLELEEESRRVKQILDEREEGENEKISQELLETQKLQRALSEQEEQGELQSSHFQDNAREQLEKALSATTAMADTNEAKAQSALENVNQLIIRIRDEIRKSQRDATEQSQAITSKSQQIFSSELDAGYAADKKTMQDATERIKAAAVKSAAELGTDSKTVEEYLAKKGISIKDLFGVEADMDRNLTLWKNRAVDASNTLDRQIYDLLSKQGEIQKSTDRAVEEQRAQMQAERKTLDTLVKNKADELTRTFSAQLASLVGQQSQEISQAHTKYEMERQNTESRLSAWQLHEDGDIEGVRTGMANVGQSAHSLAKTYKSSTEAVGNEMKDLREAVSVGFDAMLQNEQSSDRKMTSQQNDGLAVLEKLTAGLGSFQTKAKAMQDRLSDEINEETSFYSNQANSKIAAVISELNRVVEQTPDLTSGFNEDTADTKASLNSTLQHLQSSSARVADLVADMDTKLEAVTKDREDQAAMVHTNISDLKSVAADKVGEAVEALMAMTRDATRQQRAQLKRLQADHSKIEGMSGVQTNHDEGQFEQLEDEMSMLERAHETNKRWKLTQHHRTYHWRKEVNLQIRNILSSIGASADEIKSAQVGEEMDLNEHLRGVRMRMEDEVADQAVSRANFFGSMVDGTLADLQKMLGDEHKLDLEKDAMSQSAEESIASGQGLVDKELEGVDENQEELAAKAAKLKQGMVVAMHQIKGDMALPMMTANPNNVALEQRMASLDSKLNGLGVSFLETSVGVEDVIRALNQQLEQENGKMRKENRKLLAGISEVKTAHGLV